jgi:exonuclease SbcC
MIKKITIDNFMAHVHTELELGPGVTILTGPNNTGKSAVVEALRCVATNPTPSHFLRHGAKEARVGVEMDDGTKVVWVRTKRWAMYELWQPGAEEPEEYHKLQRKVPEDIQKVLRMNQVDLETSSRPVDIHIGNQREPVFLLNRPDSDAAAFFAASTESAHLLAMQDLLKLQVRDHKRESETLSADLGRIEMELDCLESLPSLELKIEAAREMETETIRYEREIPALEGVLAQGRTLAGTLKARGMAATVLEKASAPPQPAETRELAETLTLLDRAARQLGTAQGASGALQPLESPPRTEDAPSLARLADTLFSTDRTLRGVEAQVGALADLFAPPEPEKTAGLSGLLDEYIALQYRGARLDRWHGVLRGVIEPPVLEPGQELCSLLARMAGLTDRIRTQETSLSGLETDLRNIVEQLTARVDELGRCPTCGRDMTAADFLDHGGCHDS